MLPLDCLRRHLYGGYIARWSAARWGILRALAGGHDPGGQAEAAVTAALCATGGDVGHALANILLETAGQSASPNAEMINPREFAGPGDRRSPDVGVYDNVSGQLLLVCECKRHADINGGIGYCPRHPGRYANQVICYPHGCWASPGVLAAAGVGSGDGSANRTRRRASGEPARGRPS